VIKMLFELLPEILTVVFLVLSIYLTGKLQTAKRLIRETGEALVTIADAVEDNDITEEELRAIVKELSDIISSFK